MEPEDLLEDVELALHEINGVHKDMIVHANYRADGALLTSLKDPNGNYVLAPILTAKASLIASHIELTRIVNARKSSEAIARFFGVQDKKDPDESAQTP